MQQLRAILPTGLVLLLALYSGVSLGQADTYGVPVRGQKITVSARSQRLSSTPFRFLDGSLNAILAGQLTGATQQDDADSIIKYAPTTNTHPYAFKADGLGDGRDGNWFGDNDLSTPQKKSNALARREGFIDLSVNDIPEASGVVASATPTDRLSDACGEPVGFIRHELPPKSTEFVASPFIPFSAKIQEVLAGQLVGAERAEASDLVQKWIPTLQDYVTAFKSAGVATTSHNDDLARDGAWATDNQKWPLEKLTFSPGEALRVVNRHAVAQQLFLAGRVILDDTWPVRISPSLNIFSHPFVASLRLNDAGIDGGGAARRDVADFVATLYPPAEHWRRAILGGRADSQWVDADTNLPSELELKPGLSYWYGRALQEGFVWSARRPYSNPVLTTS